MPFAFIHPPTATLPSGGNIYNERILQQAHRQRFGLNSIELTDFDADRIAQLNNTYALLIWDSLFWDKLAGLSATLKTSRSSMLCHFLPSLNPRLSNQQRRQRSLLENRVLRPMRRIIVTGQVSGDIIRQRFPGKAVNLCEPGIDPAFLPNPNPPQTAGAPLQLLTVANLLPDKGYLDMLHVLAELRDHSWHWHICGCDAIDAPFTGLFRQTVKQFNLTSRITHQGVLSPTQIAGLMRNADIYVTASYYESYGMALAEAAVMRLPIISTATGSASAMVKHATNGFLFPPGNRGALRHYLRLLLDDSALRLKFRSRQRYRCQTWQQCFKTFSSICEQAAETDD